MSESAADRRELYRSWRTFAGHRSRGKAQGFDDFVCPFFPNPFPSPVFFRGRTLTERHLRGLERLFGRRAPPYFNVVAGTWAEVDRIGAQARSFGWRRKHRSTINIWTRPVRARVPAGFETVEGDYFDEAVNRPYRRLMRDVNRVGRPMMKKILRYQREVRGAGYLVVIQKSGRPVAVGAVTLAGRNAHFFAGCVLRGYRGRGLWRVLVAERQRVTHRLGARRWFMTTGNPRIAGKAHRTLKMDDFARASR